MWRAVRTFFHGLLWLALCVAGDAGALSSAEITRAELPPEALHTLQMIRQGGPFPYAKDGSIFGNRERLLPVRPRGYYREYTVPSPGVAHRGPRRIVAGIGSQRDPRLSGEYYYTADHYQTFQRIRE